MLLREIFNPDDDILQSQPATGFSGVSTFIADNDKKYSLTKAFLLSVLIHVILLGIAYFLAKFLVYILMYFGIDLDLFKKPTLKIRDIEFEFVLPDKYDIKKSFIMKNAHGDRFSLAGPEPNNRPYNGDEGSLKSESKDKNISRDKIVNQKALKNDKVASQTTKPFSKTAKKGSYIPRVNEPTAFTANMPKTEMNSEIGWGMQGKAGYHSPNAGNATFKAGGTGAAGSGTGDSVGNGTQKGGGYTYGAAGAPRPQTANNYKNEGLDIDLNPYATELQRKVVRNWSIPTNDTSKRTVLFLRISKSGNLMILNVKTPSGDTRIDELAISAVRKAQPFTPLPAGYRNSYADFILTIGHNVNARAN
ncbi:MAG: cell envelope integrity protein TolA [Candidatus Gastranaerophilales bacterium]|nr:cell envelope integrity protein TolA [Candidatus Gastranaerophilales bacterium]